jgi:hypothetical protein
MESAARQHQWSLQHVNINGVCSTSTSMEHDDDEHQWSIALMSAATAVVAVRNQAYVAHHASMFAAIDILCVSC